MATRAEPRHTPSGVLRRLGSLPVARFVADYWQRRAVCLRQALPGFVSPLTRDDLFTLGADEDVESRLVTHFGGRWRLHHGPFEASALPDPRRAGWTLLVQGVDLHDAGIAQLAARFRFLPAARFDDVMISYASDGGGVGPHVDQYDVFLLQAHGRRRWRIARRFDPRLVQDLPLRVLSNFRHEEEFVLEPGDLLYLPPGLAHEGVAQGECITISVGFRLPPWQEVADAWAQRQASVAPLPGRLPDATRRPTRTPARLPTGMTEAALAQLRRTAPTRAQARRTLLEQMTEPKPRVFFEAPRRPLDAARFRAAALRRGLILDLCSRMLYEGGDVAINGEWVAAPPDRRSAATAAKSAVEVPKPESQRPEPAALRGLRALANDGKLDPRSLSCHARSGTLMTLLHTWYRYGWLHLAAVGHRTNDATRKL